MNTAQLIAEAARLVAANQLARAALAAAYNIQEPNMGQHEVTYTIVPFGTRYRCTIYVDGYSIEKNHFYYRHDAERWARERMAALQAQLA